VPHFQICPKNDPLGDSYWVFADRPAEARRLIALNVRDAAMAEDGAKFTCEPAPSSGKMPPLTYIYCRVGRPVPIVKR
jgi:hypothetical protein